MLHLITTYSLDNIRRVVPVWSVNLRDHRILISVLYKISQSSAAECSLHGGYHIPGGKTQVLDLYPVQGDIYFRFIEFQVYIHIGKCFILSHFGQEFRNGFFQFIQILIL